MKKNILNKLLPVVILSLFILTGCEKDFLKITPTDRISEEALKSDSSLFKAFVINRYMTVRLHDKESEGSRPGFGRGFEYAIWAAVTDEGMYTNDDFTWLIQRGQLSPENTGIAGTIWGRSYRSIRECNFALSIIDEVDMSESSKKRLRAELRFIRAYRYFDLIRNYGSVVLVGDKVYQLGDDFSGNEMYEKSSIQNCITYAENELDAAALDLPKTYGSSWEKGRATKGAAMALKARLLLYAASPLYNNGVNNAEKYTKAANAAKAVMDLNLYSLHSDYSGLFKSNNSVESIFTRYFVSGSRHVCIEIAWGPNGYGGWGGFTPFQNHVDAYEMISGLPIDDPGSGYDASNPYVDRDPRFYANILYNGAPYRGRNIETFLPGGRDSRDGPSNWNTSKTGYYTKKWTDDANPINNPWSVAGLQPWHYIRYAEILLIYAEALNEAEGPVSQVYDAINEIRTRAGMPDLPEGLSQAEMRERIMRERQVELAFEEHRFYDVRRWKTASVVENLPGYGVAITKVGDDAFTYERIVALSNRRFEDKHHFLPIPRNEILSSDNKLEQTTGY